MSEDWDDGVAASLVHAYVLVGVTMLNPDRSVMLRLQVHGQVVAAHPVNGIEITLSGSRAGASYRLPPNTGVFRAAVPGLYWLTVPPMALVISLVMRLAKACGSAGGSPSRMWA
jgi:hypothetical protein